MADPFLDLIANAKRGDDDAVAKLICPHLSAMTAFVRMRLPAEVKQRESAADVVQSVCRQVIEDLPQLRASDESSFKAWLFTVLRHELINKLEFHRAQRRNIEKEIATPFPTDVPTFELAQSYGAAVSPSRVASSREEVKRIESAFDRLPQDYREVLLCVGVAKLSYREAAAVMSKTEAAVKQLTHRARARLATILD